MPERKFRVVHYLNQFFGGIGGEDKAGIPPFVKEGPTGPGNFLQKIWRDSAEIVATVICGDNFFAEKHLVVAYASQLVPEIKDALIGMREKYNGKLPSMITQITGASRTADIEKTLVLGMHGPKEIYVFFVDDIIE